MCNIIYPFLDQGYDDIEYDLEGNITNTPSKNTLKVTYCIITKSFCNI